MFDFLETLSLSVRNGIGIAGIIFIFGLIYVILKKRVIIKKGETEIEILPADEEEKK